MKTVRLFPTQQPSRVSAGHPWAFAGEIDRKHAPINDGADVELLDVRGRSLGAGLWSNRSQIAWRRYSREARSFNAGFINEALEAALARREGGAEFKVQGSKFKVQSSKVNVPAGGAFRRLVWSEADGLPGVVIDQFDDVFVVQSLTAGAARAEPEVIAWLRHRFSPAEIILRNDAPTRQRDNLPLEVKTVSGAPFAPRWFNIEGVEYLLDFAGGQKTGFYLDQREQHVRVAQYAAGARVLDCFCNQGGFALQAARAGAKSVLGLDSSAECIAAAAGNAERNGLAGTARFEKANVFDWFTANKETDERFDLIILDPPPFARDKASLDGALRGYKELNLRALKLLAQGGVLATYSCSQRVGVELFLETLADAAGDARRDVALLEITGQPSDHPALLNFPESHYLKGAIVCAR
jgi:23S rRNA (cytosine1962-C5)-methyltransferase